MPEVLSRELVYFRYYFTLQLSQIFPYWIFGMLIGSVVSVFFKDKIHSYVKEIKNDEGGFFGSLCGIILASAIGVASPLCMYGTVPIAASFSKSGIKDEFLASFMMSSILLNPQLIIYSAALGPKILSIRIISCFICGISAGILIHFFSKEKPFFDFGDFDEPKNKDTDPNIFIRYIKNLLRNFKATGLYFLVGIILSALFQRYIPEEWISFAFGGSKAWGVLMAATIGVPLYVCGGGTIPILNSWLSNGMSIGSATAFMITGPATKITNLGALKIVLGIRNFVIYWIYVIAFSFVSGILVNLIA